MPVAAVMALEILAYGPAHPAATLHVHQDTLRNILQVFKVDIPSFGAFGALCGGMVGSWNAFTRACNSEGLEYDANFLVSQVNIAYSSK